MKVLYCSITMSKRKFEEIFSLSNVKPHVVANKFNMMFNKGFVKQGFEVTNMSSVLMNRAISKKIFWSGSTEVEDGIKYVYLPFINLPVLRQMSILFQSIFKGLAWAGKNKSDSCIVVDSLNILISVGAIIAGKIRKVPVVAVVTDLPEFVSSEGSKYTKIFYKIIKYYDYYVVLTEEMNNKINFSNKPHIVIEGLVDSDMKDVSNELENKNDKKVVMYTGGLNKDYGVKNLMDAVMMLDDKDVELHLYGAGPLVDEIKESVKKDSRIKYFGVALNDVVVKEQIKATLLVNPRFSTEEYTKYSFPSKNLEYMASGTPTLTTKLPGMPKEYYDYVYLIEDESTEGVAKTLSNVLSNSREELHEKGLRAKEFVLNNKNNKIQSKKIIDMIKK